MKRITFFILSILCFTACNNEGLETEKPQTPEPQIQLVFPDAEEVKVYSTATESECKIETLWVIAFRGNAKIWAEKIDVTKIAKNGQAAQLLPQLQDVHQKALLTGDLVVCIANVEPNPDTTSVTLNTINTVFNLNQKIVYRGSEYLPMYGEMLWSGINYTCEMTRAVAKIQVQMGTSVSDATGLFNVQNIYYYIHNCSREGFIQPQSPLIGKPGPTGTIIPELRLMQFQNAVADLTTAFVYEYRSSINAITNTTTNVGITNFHTERPFIRLETPAGYYRLDFYNSLDSTFLDIKRNHHYLFTINKVRSAGYPTWTEARDNPGSNIEYTVSISDDSRYITSNGQYAIITSTDTVKIPAGLITSPGLDVATFRYNDPKGVLNTSENSVLVESTSIIPSGATLSISTSGLGPIANSNNTLTVTNASANFTQGVIVFTLGNITHRLVVKRE